jgi:hypothetical protein
MARGSCEKRSGASFPFPCYKFLVSRYQLFRRRIAPIAFGLAIALIARDSCEKQQRTHATFVLDPGAAAHDIRSVEADLYVDGNQLTAFRRNADEGAYIGPMKFEAALPEKDAELRFDVDLGARGHRTFIRHVHADEGAMVTVPLDSDLR